MRAFHCDKSYFAFWAALNLYLFLSINRQPSSFRQVCGQAAVCTTSPEAWPGLMIPRLNFPRTTTFHLLNCASSSGLLAHTSLATFIFKLRVPRLYILSSIVVSIAVQVSGEVRGSLPYLERAYSPVATGKVSTLLQMTRNIPRQELVSLVTTKTIAALQIRALESDFICGDVILLLGFCQLDPLTMPIALAVALVFGLHSHTSLPSKLINHQHSTQWCP